ncbi:hypothetical protein DL769_002574 [Monosporascus sp. CRB-8-3]|nr:hypothetical protein DL769_002574 [Monosporascus sp. CRB-8-3]
MLLPPREGAMGRTGARGGALTKTGPAFHIASTLCHPVSSTARLVSRAENEHVVLADCRGVNNEFSSQMAYYPENPRGAPQDVAVVPTPDGQYNLWIDSTTSGLFTTTGVTFTAVLGPRVAEGEYAGTGDNGYGNFSCWARYAKDLYEWDDTSCSMVYDCDHRAAPAPTTSTTGTASAAPAATTSASQTDVSTGRGLSIGAIVGVSVGSGIGAILVAVAIFLFLRHLRNQKSKDAGEETGAARGSLATTGSGSGGQQSAQVVHEMDAQWHGSEMPSESKKGELDGNPRAELPTPGEQPHGPG